MGNSVQFSVSVGGLPDLKRQLRRLSDSVRADVIKESVEKAAAPIVDRARANAPSETIRKEIKVLNTIVEGSGVVRVEAGLKGGRSDGFYGLFYEKGTKERRTKGKGPKQFGQASRGKQGKRPFMRPAFDAGRDESQRVFEDELRRRLEAVADG